MTDERTEPVAAGRDWIYSADGGYRYRAIGYRLEVEYCLGDVLIAEGRPEWAHLGLYRDIDDAEMYHPDLVRADV